MVIYSKESNASRGPRKDGKAMKTKKLTKKQAAFIQHYKECKNGAKAARLAGYSERSAANIAYENMRRPHIRNIIDAFIEAELQALREQVLAIWAKRGGKRI